MPCPASTKLGSPSHLTASKLKQLIIVLLYVPDQINTLSNALIPVGSIITQVMNQAISTAIRDRGGPTDGPTGTVWH